MNKFELNHFAIIYIIIKFLYFLMKKTIIIIYRYRNLNFFFFISYLNEYKYLFSLYFIYLLKIKSIWFFFSKKKIYDLIWVFRFIFLYYICVDDFSLFFFWFLKILIIINIIYLPINIKILIINFKAKWYISANNIYI